MIKKQVIIEPSLYAGYHGIVFFLWNCPIEQLNSWSLKYGMFKTWYSNILTENIERINYAESHNNIHFSLTVKMYFWKQSVQFISF